MGISFSVRPITYTATDKKNVIPIPQGRPDRPAGEISEEYMAQHSPKRESTYLRIPG
jgi:hypothetical protein